jgi:hypothetical protein
VIAEQEQNRAPFGSKVEQTAQALATPRIGINLPAREPKVAQVADDDKSILDFDPVDEMRQAPTSLGAIEPKMDVAQENVSQV